MYLKPFRAIAGVVIIAIGVIGLFLPLVPGILLIIAGLAVLGIGKEPAKKWIGKLGF